MRTAPVLLLAVLLAALAAVPPDALAGLPEADALRGQGRYEDAIEEYRKVLAESPDQPAALYGYAYAAVMLFVQSQGRKNLLWDVDRPLEKLVEAGPRVTEYRFLRGWHALLLSPLARSYTRKLLETAEAELEEVVRREPEHLYAQLYLATARQRMGKWEAAARAYRSVLALEPDRAGLYYPLAQCYHRAGLYLDCVGAAKLGLVKSPGQKGFHALMADCWMKREEPKKAAGAYLKALERSPDDKALYEGLASALAHSGHGGGMEALLSTFGDLARKYRTFGHGPVFYATYLRQAGRREEALKVLRDVAAVPDVPLAEWIWMWIGDLETELGRPDKGYEAYLRSLDARKDFANAFAPLRQRFIALREQKKYAEAVALLRRIAAVEPVPEIHAWVQFEIGANLQDLDDHEGTVAAWEKASELDPREPRFENSLGLEHRARGRYEEACRHFRNAMDRVIDYMYSMENLAVTLVVMGRVEEGRRILDRGVAAAEEQLFGAPDDGTRAEREFDVFKFRYFLAELREARMKGK